ncbi:hypothetical protein CLIBASIA_05170 [Candidatus Liberibacter asiaticus str. psy62]|uniref:Uncharacterized protein n=1 Tax=Liberibacter asiaticus (strain psy62) TaxID=537021 RepID=C6XGV2_LIBAP|nr:hypothetical protein CLIBASIA_05170 [Candidatus Liberibacter asiaticus str. psy62]BAP26901.1 hypothetical protein CGUJ_05170 [Candidatus Liberibacter asiaticus str. Ishi-1]
MENPLWYSHEYDDEAKDLVSAVSRDLITKDY